MSTQQKSFQVTVRGQYQALNDHGGAPSLKGYEETFLLPSQEAALSNICKHLLSPRLKKKYADYIRFRTHELVGIKLVGYTPNREVLQMGIEEMNLLELHDFCILRQLMIDPYKHGSKDIFAIRNMVQTAYTEKRLAEKEATSSKEGIATKEADVLRLANDLPPTASDPVIDINAHKATQQVQPKVEKPISEQPTLVPAASEILSDEPLPEFVNDNPVLE